MMNTAKMLQLVATMTTERLRLVLLMVAAREPSLVEAAISDTLVTTDEETFKATFHGFRTPTEQIASNETSEYPVYLYCHGSDYVDFALFPEFVKAIEENACKLTAIKWLRNSRSCSLVAAKTIIEFLSFYNHISPKFIGNAWDRDAFSHIKLHGQVTKPKKLT